MLFVLDIDASSNLDFAHDDAFPNSISTFVIILSNVLATELLLVIMSENKMSVTYFKQLTARVERKMNVCYLIHKCFRK